MAVCRRPASRASFAWASVVFASWSHSSSQAAFVAWFYPGARTGDIEYIAAPMLRLRYKAQGLAAEGMGRCEEVKHLVFLAFRCGYEIIREKIRSSKIN